MRYLLSLIALLMFVPGLHAQVGPLPCGANSSLTTWRQDFGYSIGQVVILNGVTYQSLVNNNLNQNPCTYQGTMWSNVVGTGGGGGGGTVATYTTPGLAPQGIAYVYASQVTGSVTVDQLINAAGATLPASGGIIDARGLGSNTYHITSQITALNSGTQAVTLILNPQTYFIIDTQFNTLTNDPSSCAIPVGPGGAGQGQFYGASSIIVPGANRLGNQEFFLGPNARVWDVICNGSFQGNQESMMLDGVSIRGNATATMGGALLHIQGVFGPTLVANSNTEECFGQCLEVDSANGVAGTGGGNIMFLNDVWSDYYTGSQVYPGSVVKIDAVTNQGGNGEIAFVGGIIQGNGPHNPLVVINGRGSNQLGGISFVNNYLEIQPALTSIYNANVDPVQITDANQISWDQLRLGGNKSSSQTHIIDIGSTASGNTYDIRLGSFVAGPGWSSIIHNTVDGTDETGYASGRGAIVVPAYSFGGVIPTVRLSNVVPPSSACTSQTLGTLWSDSASQTGALYVCETIGAAPTWFNVSPASPTTIAGMAPDEMNGLGLFATGASDFPTGFGATGCNAGNACTFTRSTSTVPSSNYTYSVQVNITSNPNGNMNGLETAATVAYIAGQTYVYSFWAKSDGTLVAYPTAILGNPNNPGSVCFNEGTNLLTSTWTLYTFQCTPTTSGSTNLQLGTETQGNATGSFYLAGFQFTQITPLPPTGLLSSVAPYGVGPATAAQQTITINSTPCVLGASCSVTSGGAGFTLTTTGTSGASTLIGTVLNVPNYTAPAQVYPGAGYAYSTGSAWGTSAAPGMLTPYGSDTGTSTAYAVSYTPAVALTTGAQVTIVPANTSTNSTPTLNVNSTGAVTIVKANNNVLTSLSTGDLVATVPAELVYNGTNWVLLNPYIYSRSLFTNSLLNGATGSAPYQSGASSTAFLASPTTTNHTFFYGWQPAGSALAPAVFDLSSLSSTTSASTSAIQLTGALYAAGTGTTTFPMLYLNNSGAAAPTGFATGGTEIAANAATGFTGNFLAFYLNGVGAATITSVGALTLSNSVTAAGASKFSTATAGTIPFVINNSATIPTADLQDWQSNSINIATLSATGTFTSPTGAHNEVTTTQLATPTNSAFSTSTTGGSLAATTAFFYRVAATDASGASLASTQTSQTTGAGATNTVTVNWGQVTGATGYKVYGRTTGAELLIGTITSGNTLTFVDTGSVTPSGALPAANTTGNVTVAGSVNLPNGAYISSFSGQPWVQMGNTTANTGTFIVTPGASTIGISSGGSTIPMTIQGNTGTTTVGGTLSVTPLATAGIVTNTSAGLLGTTVTVPVANGGTGAATAPAGTYFGNAGTSTAAPSFVSNSYDNLVAGAGTVPTTTGSSCGTLAVTGGTYAGTISTAGATTCTIKLNFPVTAAHGYICVFYDITTSGDYYGFGSVPTVTTTSCQNTSSSIGSGDTLQFMARPY